MRRLSPLHSFVGAFISRLSNSEHGIARAAVRPLSSGTRGIIFYALLPHICLWPLPGRLKPPAQWAPLSGRRSRFSGGPTWKGRRWSSICPRRRTGSWTPRPVKHRDSWSRCRRRRSGTAATAMRINLCLISTESRSQSASITCQGTVLFLYPSITDVYKWCPSSGSKYPAVAYTVLSAPCFHQWSHIWLVMVAPCVLAARPQAIPHHWYHRHALCPVITAAQR